MLEFRLREDEFRHHGVVEAEIGRGQPLPGYKAGPLFP
jgi:hypothetical protein